MDLDRISFSSQKLIERAKTRDPFRIAEEIGIKVRFKDLGKLMGMYKYFDKYNRFITINQSLYRCAQIVICHHEIGHDINDQDIAKNSILQDSWINIKDPIELRANMHAVETQFDDHDILELIEYGYTVDQIAMETGTYSDYVAIKLEMLRHKGYKLRQIEYDPHFLRVAEGKQNGSYYSSC